MKKHGLVRVDGNKLRIARVTYQGYGLSQFALQEKSGIDQTTISKIEKGHRPNVELVTIVALASALGVSVDSLVEFKSSNAEAIQEALIDLAAKDGLQKSLSPNIREKLEALAQAILEEENRAS